MTMIWAVVGGYLFVGYYRCTCADQESAEVTFHKGALSVFPLGRPLGRLKTLQNLLEKGTRGEKY